MFILFLIPSRPPSITCDRQLVRDKVKRFVEICYLVCVCTGFILAISWWGLNGLFWAQSIRFWADFRHSCAKKNTPERRKSTNRRKKHTLVQDRLTPPLSILHGFSRFNKVHTSYLLQGGMVGVRHLCV